MAGGLVFPYAWSPQSGTCETKLIHDALFFCRNFHDKIKKFAGRYAPFAIRSKNGRYSIVPPTDLLVHVSTTRGAHYFLITYEFGD